MSEWIEYELGELLSYEQPTPFIVESTDYDDSYPIPVLTAGKSFLLGYTNEKKGIYDTLPVIIFDDFTTASQYVNFKFKVKSSAMKILTANKKLVLPKFIFYRMQIIDFDASTHKRYWIQHYSKIKVAIPSLPEQERIVAKIEELFSQLDDGVNTLEKLQRQIDTYRQSVLKYIFEDKIKSTDYKEIPLKNLVIPQGGLRRGPFGGSIKKSCFVSEGYKVYEQGNAIHDSIEYGKYFISQEKYEEMRSFQVQPHDLLVSCSGTVGCIMELPDKAPSGIINQALLRIRLNKAIISNAFFIQYFRAAVFQRKIISQGSAMQNLVSIKEFKEATLNVPSKEMQEALLVEVSQKLSICDKIEEIIRTSEHKAEALRQSILKKHLTEN